MGPTGSSGSLQSLTPEAGRSLRYTSPREIWGERLQSAPTQQSLATTAPEGEVKAQLRAWIVKQAKKPVGKDFGNDTALLQKGILTSLDIVEFVLFIENLRGTEIDPDAIEPEAFTSVNSIYTVFFGRS